MPAQHRTQASGRSRSPSGTTSTSVSATVADRISASSARAGSGALTPMARAWERCTAT
ncbi:hypothetical protein [Streptomyces rapamycinicus]|uniref:hypothetical protein n=1 Tax=Streptomyces rapamycinicus TaxID=1226757 RepID=UPI0032D90D1A